jgi:hypothetical protein
MKRFVLSALVVAFATFSSVASASPGAASRGVSPAVAGKTMKTSWTAEYDAASYYGAVKCTGETIVSKKYPGGKDIETCETTETILKRMTPGKGQHAFLTAEGGSVGEWESDSGDGERTTDFSYKVNGARTKFKLIAIYAAPEA